MEQSIKFAPKPGETPEQKQKRVKAILQQLLKNHDKYVRAKAKVDAEAIQRAKEYRNIVINR